METASAQCIPQNTYKVVSVHKWSKNVHWILTISIKSYLDNKSQERFYRVPVSKWSRARTVDKDILIRYRFSDKKFPQPLVTTNDLLQEQGIWNNTTTSLFHKLQYWQMSCEWKEWVKQQAEKKSIEVFCVFLDNSIFFDNFC